ncbi:hypothetical protein [Mycobacterium sp.]|uniref:hypothetical protein n=1 Tax=Mycobacterium sp. TaxID=1785 RepID=UPI003D145B02
MGVILWYQVDFTELKTKISNDVYSGDYLDDAEIKVEYDIGTPASFNIEFKNLPLDVNRAIADKLANSGTGSPSGVEVEIKLGYLDDPGSQKRVIKGRVHSMKGGTRFPPLGLKLLGYEEAAYALLTKYDPDTKLALIAEPAATPTGVVEQILGLVNLKPVGEVTPTTWSFGTAAEDGTPAKPYNLEAPNLFALLKNFADYLDAEILVQDGGAQFGVAIVEPANTSMPTIPPNPSVVLSLLTAESALIRTKDLESARLAEFKPYVVGSPAKQRVITEPADQTVVDCFDFTVLGSATFRAGQPVIASVDGYDNPFKAFRILKVTHTFSPVRGYVCTGRAATFDPGGNNRAATEKARVATAPAVADLIVKTIKEAQATLPSVDVGRVKTANPVDRVADLYFGQERNPGVSTPCVDLDVKVSKSVLSSKPLAAPFAWHKVGLTVPVYEGMRALLNQGQSSRNNAVVAGFLWANNAPKMDRPKSNDGDWWLCLPTEVSGDPKLPTGKGVNDLVSAKGLRVIEAVGLKVVVGKDSCSAVGERPTEGDADVLLISHSSGTTIQIDAQGNVAVQGKGTSVSLACGGATLTVGSGKVSIS